MFKNKIVPGQLQNMSMRLLLLLVIVGSICGSPQRRGMEVHRGHCPLEKVRIEDSQDTILSCDTDKHCYPNERCCSLKDSQLKVCQPALIGRMGYFPVG